MSKAEITPRLPHYEIVEARAGSFWVLRHHDGKATIIERFHTERDAEEFTSFLAWTDQAPRRLAAH